MRNSKRLVGLLAVGIAAAIAMPATSVLAATKTTKKAAKKTTTTKAPATTAAPATTSAPATTAAAAAKRGGRILIGLEAESDQGWWPPYSQWAISGHLVSYSMMERLVALNADGGFEPWLAESFTPSSDYRTWTFKIRKGIKFHNGETLDADAVVLNLTALKDPASVVFTAFLNMVGATATDANTVVVTTRVPWISLPSYFAGQGGTIVAPEQIKAKSRNKPIGTGPYIFKDWVVSDRLVVTKNPAYWGPVKGVSDEIIFRPIPDESARTAQLQSGDIDFAITANYLTLRDLKVEEAKGKLKAVPSTNFGEVNYIMLNQLKAPLDDLRVRQALAYALDKETLRNLRAPGATLADGPFPPGSLGYLPDSGLPKYDLEKAKALVADYERTTGKKVKFVLGTTSVPDNIETTQVIKAMWARAGIDVDLFNTEQQRYIGNALVGNFDAYTWRSHGGTDPDQQRVWWHSESATPPPGIAINFGRIRDGIIDTALDQIRSNSDPVVRKRATEVINRDFAENVYNLWTWRTTWTLGMCFKCGGLDDARTVNGSKTPLLPSGHFFAGTLYKG